MHSWLARLPRINYVGFLSCARFCPYKLCWERGEAGKQDPINPSVAIRFSFHNSRSQSSTFAALATCKLLVESGGKK
eukprot:996520-Amphidinium_carterae.2